MRRALSHDWDPYFLKGLAAVSYEISGKEGGRDIAALRAALAYSLATLELRPFDADALYFAGQSLWHLRRQADARMFLDDAQKVRFPPIGRSAPVEDLGRTKRKLGTFRSLGLLHDKRTIR